MLREIKTIVVVVVVVAMHVYLKNHSSKINKGYKSKKTMTGEGES